MGKTQEDQTMQRHLTVLIAKAKRVIEETPQGSGKKMTTKFKNQCKQNNCLQDVSFLIEIDTQHCFNYAASEIIGGSSRYF